jgi:hypothetical protein
MWTTGRQLEYDVINTPAADEMHDAKINCSLLLICLEQGPISESVFHS